MSRSAPSRPFAGRRRAVVAVALALWAVCTATAHAADAQIVSERRVSARVVELQVSTPALAAPTRVTVDLPAGYDAQPDRRWPVTYFLAGTMNNDRAFNDIVGGLKLTEGYPSIVVSPDGDNGSYWSDWYNGGAFGAPKFETYVSDQLIALIDRRFRTIADRSQRVIAGVSMGGYGAVMLAARHPDRYAAVASISGVVDNSLVPTGAVLSISSTFDGGPVDAIYGPRATQEIRWRGHNPTDLAGNLRDLDLQVRTADGLPNPGIGEQLLSADTVSCVVEAGVYAASVSFHRTLVSAGIPHAWKDYGSGCHTPENFQRQIVDVLRQFQTVLAHPRPVPASFSYSSIEPDFDIWGWHVAADRRRAAEFLRLDDAGASGLTLTGSGLTTVTSPPSFAGVPRVDLAGATAGSVVPDPAGRIRFVVDLGPPDAAQQLTPGATTRRVRRAVSLRPQAVVVITRSRPTRGHLRVCAHTVGGTVAARLAVTGARRRVLTRGRVVPLGPEATCRSLRWTRRLRDARGTLRVTGTDGVGHPVAARRTFRVPAALRR
ncbi:alpha/beta hydrolase-fold protein [Patulibacter sp. NPDC049589]|uniref:alpha/beta hydrolase-fold protein n=1 Tax=Patulibacter sp. NPDC049589 TaxID=3154731 RepID=UPI00344694BE